MADDTNKIAEKLKTQDRSWWSDLLTSGEYAIGDYRRMAQLLSSIGLTVSDDAGVLAKVRNLVGTVKESRRDFLQHINGVHSDFHARDRAENLLARTMIEVMSVLESPQPAPSTDDHPEPTAFGLIQGERDRQISKGFNAKHDDEHKDGSILTAAGRIIYDLEGGTHTSDPELEDDPDATWPERLSAHVLTKYGEDPIHRLAIAGALIVAEIERLQRVSLGHRPEPGEAEAKSGPEWKEEYGYASSPDYDPSDGPAKTLGLKPTAETRGDDGFEKYWKSADIWAQDRDARTKKYCLASWKAARADLLSKIAGVRDDLTALRDIADDNRSIPKDPYEKGYYWGKANGLQVAVQKLRDLAAAFPSDPGAVKA